MKYLHALFSKDDAEWRRQMANENLLHSIVPKKYQADKAIDASL